MKKGWDITVFLVLLLLVVPLVSAGFFDDLWNRITGKATQPFDLNITVGVPEIRTVYNGTMTPNPVGGLSSGPNPTGIIINFTVYLISGAGNLDDSSAVINFSRAGEELRQNSSCYKYQNSTYYANYTCNVTMWWWDGAGAWNIEANILDDLGNMGRNITATLSVGSTTGFEMGPTVLTWASISAGSTNQTSNNHPLLLNNTGNAQFGAGANQGNITMNATNLRGETTSSYMLFARNFSVSTATGGGLCSGEACLECAGTQMGNWSYVNITYSNLTKGNYTLNNGYTGQEQLYSCLRIAGSDLITQSYSTVAEGSWVVQIL